MSVTTLLFACLALAADARSPQEKKALEEMYAAPAAQLGSWKDEIIKSIGKPRAIEETPGENESKTYRITFKEAEVLILHSPNFGNQSWIMHFRLKRSIRKLKLPVRIGASSQKALELFGAPTTGGAENLTYIMPGAETGDDGNRLIFHLSKDKITEIEWSQYMD